MHCELIDHMGTDLSVVNSARVSFNKHKDVFDGSDIRLINFLARNDHWTPFAQTSITLRETVPIFVARQRFKHAVGFVYNEVSRRYVTDEPEFFCPEVWRTAPAKDKKQGSGDGTVELLSDGTNVNKAYEEHLANSKLLYTSMLEANVAPEMARMVLSQSMYTSYYVTGSLIAFVRAFKLRDAELAGDAQKEIALLAKQWNELISPLFPESWIALTKKY